MSIAYLRNKYYVTRSSRLLVPTIKPQAKENVSTDIVLLFHILQKLNSVPTSITMRISMLWDITPCSDSAATTKQHHHHHHGELYIYTISY
jgi:hypothetical protein